jgi:hypothetical protein
MTYRHRTQKRSIRVFTYILVQDLAGVNKQVDNENRQAVKKIYNKY